MNRQQVIARDRIFLAMVDHCREELLPLWQARLAIFMRPDWQTLDTRETSRLAREWLDARHLSADWLADRLIRAMQLTDAPSEIAQEADLCRPQHESAILDGQMAAVRVALLVPTLEGLLTPSDDELQRDPQRFIDDYQTAQRRLGPLRPLHANPSIETRADFLQRAGAHYDAAAKAVGARQLHGSPEITTHAEWLIRHRRFGHSYNEIAHAHPELTSEAVRKAIRRIAALAAV